MVSLFKKHVEEAPWVYPVAEAAFVDIPIDVVEPTAIDVDDLAAFSPGPVVTPVFDGDKFFGGFGDTKIFDEDYWTLRKRSSQLFTENLYARGIIRRFITNEINIGLMLEACPDESVIGLEEDSLAEWAEDVENKFHLWAKTPELCDFKESNTWGAIQREIRLEALVAGDVLVVLHQSQKYKLPQVQLIRGDDVQTPYDYHPSNGNKIEYGVELDKDGRHTAYHVRQADGTSKRILAKGPRSGRKIAWLVYGTEKRLNKVRGMPLLSIVLQSLKEIDRYRDSAQRKALINSIYAATIEKTHDKMGTLPITGGAVKKDSATVTDGDGSTRTFPIANQIPGVIIQELQTGEVFKPHSTAGTDVNLGPFEEVIIQAIAWANEVPPEIMRLAFSNNYSASQAAINEYKMTLNVRRTAFGDECPQIVYKEVLLSMVLLNKIKAPGLLKAWRDPSKALIFAAWVSADWSGAIKPSTDIKKQSAGYKEMVAEGWVTNSRASRELTGTKFTKNIKRLRRENVLKAEAARPLLELKQEFGGEETDDAMAALDEKVVSLAAVVEDLEEMRG